MVNIPDGVDKLIDEYVKTKKKDQNHLIMMNGTVSNSIKSI